MHSASQVNIYINIWGFAKQTRTELLFINAGIQEAIWTAICSATLLKSLPQRVWLMRHRREKRQRSHAAAISLTQHISWIKKMLLRVYGVVSNASQWRDWSRIESTQESNSSPTSRSSTAHNKMKKKRRGKHTLSLMSPAKLEWQTLAAGD